MQISRLIEKYDLLLTHHFFDDATCQRIIDEAQASDSKPATIYGYGDDNSHNDRVRKASRLGMSATTTEFVHLKLLEHIKMIERHFSISLSDCEQPQFLRYDVGGFFVAHQDGNTGLLQLTSDAERRVSVVIFLNRQSEKEDSASYSGGSLKFSDYRAEPEYREFYVPAEAGTLVAFRSELTHEVTPVTHGKRYSIVSWYR
ncbi:MAG: 2OG-Fe(II) oxygenase [Blastocatellia bacterium]|nr:MAG: 2OG-Fe(II) oxygenase [Blastocatellia bacterium]